MESLARLVWSQRVCRKDGQWCLRLSHSRSKQLKKAQVPPQSNGNVRNLYQPRYCTWHWNLPSCLSTTRQLLQLHSDAAPLSLPMLGLHAARHHGHQGHGVPGGSAEGRPSESGEASTASHAQQASLITHRLIHYTISILHLSTLRNLSTLYTYWQHGCAILRQNIHAFIHSRRRGYGAHTCT